ncbi:hypothetical protein [Streptomyces physcomitrii]|uniref:DUF1449 domain-containing protein n=1 Tax=Streptomyces physcomitrii TaxID=2724184 RepID=A0ABX1GZY3_9ACTN|nr:hypothetical protein [Streptomyces physcomitrii]NKI41657.1 hypothetical protein [Streptomyces physcomitrii]
MRTFVETAAGFPTILFTAALVVVLVFWVLVAVGVGEAESFDADADFGAWGLGGVPVSIAFSLLTALAWFLSLASSLLIADAVPAGAGTVRLLGELLASVLALLLAWRLTRLLVRPFARLFPDEPGPSRQDFLGRTCTIRTGRVDGAFGQAEVAAADGSTALVQVRQTGTDPLRLGSTGLLYAYDSTGEFFWVASFEEALDPRD